MESANTIVVPEVSDITPIRLDEQRIPQAEAFFLLRSIFVIKASSSLHY